MGKCPHCGSSRIRKRYRQHRRYNWRCRRCNEVFRRPKRSVWLWIGAIAVISIAVAYVYSQDIISIPSTPAPVDESVDRLVKVVTYTATLEMGASQTPAQLAAPVDTPAMTTTSPVPTHRGDPNTYAPAHIHDQTNPDAQADVHTAANHHNAARAHSDSRKG